MIRTIVVAAVLGLGVTAVLAQSDPITERRNAMKAVGAATRDGAAIAKGEMLGYLATCDWCLSIWVAPVPSVLAIAFPENRLVLLAFVALSASALTGLIATIESRIDR